MATRATPTSTVALSDLRACLTPADIFSLFGKFHYPVEAPVDVPVEAEELPGALRDGVAAREREVDEIVYRTYGLTAAEAAEIERWHAARRALLGKGKRRGAGEAAEDAISGEGDDGGAEE